MAKIYGREADIEKVRADEDALRQAMLDFVAANNFKDEDQFGKFVRAAQSRAACDTPNSAHSVDPKKAAEAA